jgi:hypothetical protein
MRAQLRVHRALRVLCTTVAFVQLAKGAEPKPVILRTYNSFGVSAEELRGAERVVEGLLDSVGIHAIWRSCRIAQRATEPLADACMDPVAANELIVRIVASVDDDKAAYRLGFSYVDPVHGMGTLATVFADRVATLAATLETDAGVVLGRAVAHEIGHLLMGTQVHSASGLMRATWSNETILANRLDDWGFSAQQASEMRAAADARRPVVK